MLSGIDERSLEATILGCRKTPNLLALLYSKALFTLSNLSKVRLTHRDCISWPSLATSLPVVQ
jgi:hypothetical protein